MPSRETEDLVPDHPPTSIDPYSVLSIPQNAGQAQIKAAYRRAALKYHPDKTDAPDATQRFQEVAFAYAVLSDQRRRARYDATGRTEESVYGLGDENVDDGFDWRAFYAAQYESVITSASIEAFRKEYQGSEEERLDVLAAYTKYKGSMAAIFSHIMLSEEEKDASRFRALIKLAISSGEVEDYKKFHQKSRRKRGNKEAAEAEELAKELGLADKLAGIGSKGKSGKENGGGEDALQALIMQRQKGRAKNFLADLEAKYAPKLKGKNGGKKEQTFEEPSEELFAQSRKRGKAPADENVQGSKKSKRSKASA